MNDAPLTGENPLAGLPIIRPETHGRYSLSERAALKFRELLRRSGGLTAELTAAFDLPGHLDLSPAEVLA